MNRPIYYRETYFCDFLNTGFLVLFYDSSFPFTDVIWWIALWISVAYLLGLPILAYSLDIGKEHVNLIDERLEKLIYSGQLDAKELDR